MMSTYVSYKYYKNYRLGKCSTANEPQHHNQVLQQTLSITAHHFLSPPYGFLSLPTASCHCAPLAITPHAYLLLTRRFLSLCTPSC